MSEVMVKIKRAEKLGGIRLVPGHIMPLPQPIAEEAIKMGVAEAIGPGAVLADNGFPGAADGRDVLIRMGD